MVRDLEFLKTELDKVREELSNTNPRNYKRYATLVQVYYGYVNSVNQQENIEKQIKAEEERQRENEEAMKEAEAEIKAEEEAEKQTSETIENKE